MIKALWSARMDSFPVLSLHCRRQIPTPLATREGSIAHAARHRATTANAADDGIRRPAGPSPEAMAQGNGLKQWSGPVAIYSAAGGSTIRPA